MCCDKANAHHPVASQRHRCLLTLSCFEVNHPSLYLQPLLLRPLCLHSYQESLCADLWHERLKQARPVLALQAPNPIIHFHWGQEFRIRLSQRLCVLSGVNRAGTTSRLSQGQVQFELLYDENEAVGLLSSVSSFYHPSLEEITRSTNGQ